MRDNSPTCLPRAHRSSPLMSTGQGHSVTTCVRPQEHCHSDLGRFGCTDLSMQCSPTACPTMQVADAQRCVRCTRIPSCCSHPSADVAVRRGQLLAQGPNDQARGPSKRPSKHTREPAHTTRLLQVVMRTFTTYSARVAISVRLQAHCKPAWRADQNKTENELLRAVESK